ncbi:MAG: DUF2207 domain-containing protein, partial [Acidobacteria bacterium]
MGTANRSLLRLAAIFALAAIGATAASARSLHWRSLAVSARLDADGVLHVVERQTMVFDGAWNGGERGFDLKLGQRLALHGIRRIDEGGRSTELQAGDLDRLDHYDWAGDSTLRWRSRLPSDPPFAATAITYVLDYSLQPVLVEEGGVYRFDHDFAFASRPGPIERFTLDLELDPAWRAATPLPRRLERLDLPPGRGVRLTAELAYAGGGRPAAVLRQLPFALRFWLVAAMLLGMAVLVLDFRRHEASRGRHERPDVPPQPDRAWLAEHLFNLLPEEAGALWDRRVGPPEVAAVIARLVAEGKLASSLVDGKGRRGKKVLALELRAPREAFTGYERTLIDKLFFDGRTHTDTEAIRRHYRKSGFNPAALLRRPLEKRLREHPALAPPPGPGRTWRLPAALFAACALLLVVEGISRGSGALVVMAFMLPAAPLPLAIGVILALVYRRLTRHLGVAFLGLLLPALLLAAVSSFALLFAGAIPDFYPGRAGVLALALLPLAAFALVLHLARTRDARRTVRERQRLGAVRRYFAHQLRRREPELEDGWFPYLVAFGLERQVDRWFARFGGASTGRRPASISTAGAGGGGTAQWSGGGGAFGGAGAA